MKIESAVLVHAAGPGPGGGMISHGPVSRPIYFLEVLSSTPPYANLNASSYLAAQCNVPI